MTLPELIELLYALQDIQGEAPGLSELDHGLQCAHELALVRPDDTELQIAGLVHDIGHQFASDDAHGRIGAERVRDILGDRVASLVEAHIPAKRYLVTTDPSYSTALSDVSVISLGMQGGPLFEGEIKGFLSLPCSEDAVVLRRADDAAKVPGRSVPPLEDWIPVLTEVAR